MTSHTGPLDLRAVELELGRLLDLYRDMHSHARSDNPDVVRADIFALSRALLAHCRALRAALIESLGMSATNKAFPEIQKRAAAVLAQATDGGT